MPKNCPLWWCQDQSKAHECGRDGWMAGSTLCTGTDNRRGLLRLPIKAKLHCLSAATLCPLPAMPSSAGRLPAMSLHLPILSQPTGISSSSSLQSPSSHRQLASGVPLSRLLLSTCPSPGPRVCLLPLACEAPEDSSGQAANGERGPLWSAHGQVRKVLYSSPHGDKVSGECQQDQTEAMSL